jgi:hypothetical protein
MMGEVATILGPDLTRDITKHICGLGYGYLEGYLDNTRSVEINLSLALAFES